MKISLEIFGLAAILAYQVSAIPTGNLGGKKMVCYFGSWAVYRPGPAAISVADLDPGLCTHFIYTFVGLAQSSASVISLDTWNDYDLGNLAKSCAKAKASGTKCMVALGGWNEGSLKYSQVVCNPDTRSKLVQSIVTFVKLNNLDGFDLDWEYPGQRGGSPNDRECYSALIKELSTIFKANGWVLSAAVNANPLLLAGSYDVPVLSEYLDMINVMAYDFHGSWEDVTGHNAPLYASASDIASGNGHLSVSASIRAWINLGANPSKVMMGLGMYGRSFNLLYPSQHDIGAPAGGNAPFGYVAESGFYGYNDICANNASWTTKWNDEQKVPYAFSGNNWVGYDDTASIRLKGCLANELQLGGLMVWSVETDDFRGVCKQGKYPLINAAVASLQDTTCGGSFNYPPSVSEEPTTNSPITDSTTSAPLPNSGDEISAKQPAPTEPNTELTSEPTTESEIDATTLNPLSTTEQTVEQIVVEGEISNDLNLPECNTLGQMIRDHKDCSSFWYCVYGPNVSLFPVKMSCGDTLGFDITTKTCNYRSAVRC